MFVGIVVIAPAGLALTYELALRTFVRAHYGAPVLHDYAEGEFPRLLAAMRSVESVKDNRLVMVTQDRLTKLRDAVPPLVSVLERLPEPGPTTYSCRLHGVCSEWSNGWMLFWIKDAAFQAGLTPTLPAAQDYFRRARAEIEVSCAAGRLRCNRNGDGLLPPMELRWIRAYVAEGNRLIRMSFAPALYPKVAVPAVALPRELRQAYEAIGISTTGAPVSKPLATIREALVTPHQMLAAVLLAGALLALGARLWIADMVPLSPIALIGAIVALYSLIRLAALTYVAVYLGPFTSRIVFSTYLLSILVALPFIVETIQAWRKARVA